MVARRPLQFHQGRNVDNVEDFKYVKWLRNHLKTVDAWPVHSKSKRKIQKRYVLPIFSAACFISQTVYLKNGIGTLSFVVLVHSYICFLINGSCLCRGILIATERYKRLATCYLKTVHLFHHKNRSEHAMKIHVIVHRLSHYYTIYLISLVFVGMVLFNFMPIYNNINSGAFKSPRPENVTFQHAMYLALPFDYTTNIKGYFVVFILNWYISLVTTSHFCTFDLFISLMIIHLWGHIKILMCSLEDIEGFVPGSSFKFTIEQNRKIYLILQECIRHHQFTIDFTNEMSSTFGLVILFYYFFYQVSGCLLLLACSQMDIESLSRFGPMTFILFQQLIQLSIVFELISSLSENLPNAVYNVPWEFMDKNNRKMIQVLLLQSQKLIQFKATSMMNVGVQAMATILKTSVSYFIMLRTMYQEH
uniref:Odorant receptor n=1 Tax=Bombyx mori TaxID=7091 RepID=C4B7U3_BOMMO|nr:olfactory receptor [Bombyx mori]